METVDEREFWGLIRQALLMFVDAIERFQLRLPNEQRTAELRKTRRNGQ